MIYFDKLKKQIQVGDILQDKDCSMKGIDEFGEVVLKDGKYLLKIHKVLREGHNYFNLEYCLDDFEKVGNNKDKELLKKIYY